MAQHSIYTRYRNNIFRYLAHSVQTQLILTIVAFPILVGWGLGTSFMTFVGNLVFTPILLLFLVVSSLLFFTELFGIPNSALTHILNLITFYWDKVLAWSYPSWIITCAYPGFWPLLLVTLVALWIIQHRKLNSLTKKMIAMGIILLVMVSGLLIFSYVQQRRSGNSTFIYHDTLTLKTVNQSLFLIDDGFFARKKAAENVVLFEIKPYLVKNIGSTHITAIIITKPSLGSFTAASTLCKYCFVDAVFVAYTKQKLSKHVWKEFFTLQAIAAKQSIKFDRFALTNAQRQSLDSTDLLEMVGYADQK
jgi:hypothetical protein